LKPVIPGRDSHQAILPDALRVNANLFQTDLCRHPEHMDVLVSLAIHGIWIPAIPYILIPANKQARIPD